MVFSESQYLAQSAFRIFSFAHVTDRNFLFIKFADRKPPYPPPPFKLNVRSLMINKIFTITCNIAEHTVNINLSFSFLIPYRKEYSINLSDSITHKFIIIWKVVFLLIYVVNHNKSHEQNGNVFQDIRNEVWDSINVLKNILRIMNKMKLWSYLRYIAMHYQNC